MSEVEITARRKLVFNLGRYEQQETEVIITGISMDTDPEEVSAQLDLLVAPEVLRAKLATSHAPEDNATSVYTWEEIVNKTKEGADA